MPRLRSVVVLIGVFSLSAFGQSKVITTPNCTINFTLTSSGARSTTLDNRSQQCAYWSMGYVVNGFSAITIVLQSAPDSAGAPGSWTTYSGTAAIGAISSSTTPSAYLQVTPTVAFNPWVSVTLSSATGSGSVVGSAVGWVSDPGGSGGGGGGVTSDVNIAEVAGAAPAAIGSAPAGNPLFVAGVDGNGNLYAPQTCTLSAVISTSATTTLLVTGASSKKVRICNLQLTPASAVDVQLVQGTGATCGTGTSNLSGLLSSVTALDTFNPAAPLIGASGNSVCLSLSSGVASGGTVIYSLN